LDTQTSDDKQDLEQYSYYYDKNKHLSGTDAYIYMVPDDPRPDERNYDITPVWCFHLLKFQNFVILI
jgi:hypothetical protein